MNKRKIISILLALIVLLCMFFATACGGAESTGGEGEGKDWPASVTLIAGPVGGPWYPVMVTFAEYLTEEIPEVTWTVIDGGSLGNIRVVNEGVDAQIGLTHLNMLEKALEGTLSATEGETFDNVAIGNAVTLSYIQFVTPVKNEHINDFKDIFDKRFAPGQLTSAQTYVIEDLLAYYGESFDSIKENGGSVEHINFSEMATLLKDGHLDVACFTGDLPHASGMEVDLTSPLKLLTIEEEAIKAIKEKYPSLAIEVGEPGCYSGVTEPVTMLGAVGTLIFNKSLPDDLVYEFTRVIMNNSEKIVNQYTSKTYSCYLNWEDTLQFSSEEDVHPMVWKAVKEGPSN
ncbi:MAG: TAXI family TRAP transporter solute-binding subunit [Clostridiales bacterium]|nr:TAXI family TRAP transporter solute-binding subunit [Clostridiales bacterium]